MKDKLKVRFAGILQLLITTAALAAVAAQAEPFPAHPVKMVVPFSTGGVSDFMGRVIADGFRETAGIAMVVENRPGAGGTVGLDAVAKSAPNGYTLALATVGFASNAVLQPSSPFDPLKDFTPLLMIGSIPSVIVVHPSLPVKNVREFIDYAKKNPGQLNFGSSGPGTGSHLAVETFKWATQTQMQHVPYKSTAQAIPDLLAGRIQFMFDFPTTASEPVKAGKLNALAVTSAKRTASLPDVPTLAEGGISGYEFTTWAGILAPAGLSPAVADKLTALMIAVLESPEVKARFAQQSIEVAPLGRQKFGEFIRADIERWRMLLRGGHLAMLN
jgi:tripartite-type tricarboxylate transporter receptor subunit TctC